MRIRLIDVDGHNFPNLALMKLSAFHKNNGDDVDFFKPLLEKPDKIYASKIFSFKPDFRYFPNGDCEIIKGGTAYDMNIVLNEQIEHIMPDYELYNINYGMGFLTRGCVRKCKWCVVPQKEGHIRANADYSEFANRKSNIIIFLDNNVLACEHGLKQIEKLGKTNIKVDFNQGLDARLIDRNVAKMLSKIKWHKPIRLSCDTSAQIPVIKRAVKLLREENATPKDYMVYVLLRELEDSYYRINEMKKLRVEPFAQPFRDYDRNTKIPQWQKDMARWCNRREALWSMDFKDYMPFKNNFKCSEYFRT